MSPMTPLPGDPARVAREAQAMIRAAERMQQVASTLRRLAKPADFQSKAIDALGTNAEEVAVVMTKASTRYRGAGDALADYAPRLDAAQRQAERAISQAGAVDPETAGREVDRLQRDLLNPLSSPEQRDEATVELARARADLARQQASQRAAEALYADAVADRDRAATEAMKRIQEANRASGLDDSAADKIMNFVEKYVDPILDAVVEVLSVAGDILGAIALLLAFIPGLQAVAVAFTGLALALKLISVAAMALQALRGRRTWGSVLSGAISAAVSVVLKGGKLKELRNVFSHKGRLINQMSFSESARFAAYGASKEGIAYKAGFLGLGTYVAREGVEDFDVHLGGIPVVGLGLAVLSDATGDRTGEETGQFVGDLAADWAGGAFDRAVDPDSMWTTQDIGTKDLSAPLTPDFSGIDPSALVAESFGSPGQPVGAMAFAGGGRP